MKYLRFYNFMPRIAASVVSNVAEDGLTYSGRRDERHQVLDDLKKLSNEELGAKVREWLEHPDVQGYPFDFTEWTDQRRIDA